MEANEPVPCFVVPTNMTPNRAVPARRDRNAALPCLRGRPVSTSSEPTPVGSETGRGQHPDCWYTVRKAPALLWRSLGLV